MSEKLLSLEAHESYVSQLYKEQIYPLKNGIACPKCGIELFDSNPEVLTTYPPRKAIQCLGCQYKGYRTV